MMHIDSLDDLLTVLDSGTIRQKQGLVKKFVERVDMYEERVHIKLRFSIDSLMKQTTDELSVKKAFC